MRLDPHEVQHLPLPAALIAGGGEIVASTPEWLPAATGSVVYHAGHGSLVVAATSPATPGLDGLMGLLLRELRSAARVLEGDQALQAGVLLAGLGLVAGRPLDDADRGTTSEVLAFAASAIRARSAGLEIELVEQRPRPQLVTAPATVALALVQLAVNARDHEGAQRVRMRVEAGPSFYVEWTSLEPGSVAVRTHRHQRDRERWGWGYVRMAADMLGGAALPPAPSGPGLQAACLSIGSRRLTLPLAVFDGGHLQRSTWSWIQETQPQDAEERTRVGTLLATLLAKAAAAEGQISLWDVYSARRVGSQTWLSLPPETGSGRVRDVLRGLEHERALWSAPEPYLTRVAALGRLLSRTLGEAWEGFDPSSWERSFPAACAALSIRAPAVHGPYVFPDPRVAALLLSEVGGDLLAVGGGVAFRPGQPAHLLVQGLAGDRDGLIQLTPDLVPLP